MYIFIQFANLSAIISSDIFSASFSVFSVCDAHNAYIGPLDVVLQVP